MGQHSKLSTHSPTGPMVAVAIATSGAFASVPLAQGVASAAPAAPSVNWAPIIHCESGGDPTRTNPASTASGAFQFLDSTWRTLGGRVFGQRAKDASFAQQTQIANRAYAQSGLNPWQASRSCWRGKLSSSAGGGHTARSASAEKHQGGHKHQGKHAHHGKHSAQSAPSTPDTPVSAPATSTYVVRAGDSLSGIAAAHGLHTWQELFTANKAVITNPNLIHAGITITLPGEGSTAPDTSADTATMDSAKDSGSRDHRVKDSALSLPLAGEKVTGMAAIGREQSIQVQTTGYSFGDNQGGSNAKISAPVLHTTAGGDGTYQNPVTLAVPGHGGSGMQTPKGTRVYFPQYKFYGIVEDSGASPKSLRRFDIWTDGRGNSSAKSCMDDLTGTSTAILNPPPGEPVSYKGPRSDSQGCHAS